MMDLSVSISPSMSPAAIASPSCFHSMRDEVECAKDEKQEEEELKRIRNLLGPRDDVSLLHSGGESGHADLLVCWHCACVQRELF